MIRVVKLIKPVNGFLIVDDYKK